MAMKLESIIDFVDYGLSSQTSTTLFLTTRRDFEVSGAFQELDGATYYFEVVAINTNVDNAYNVTLMWFDFDIATWTVDKTVSVPANTTDPTRIRSSSFTPTTDGSVAPTWRCIQTPATGSSGDVRVYAARVVVVQTGATKTKLFIPMSSRDDDNTTGADSGTFLDFNSTTTFGNTLPDSQAIWKYEADKWASGAISFNVALVMRAAPVAEQVQMALVDISDDSVVASAFTSSLDHTTVKAGFNTGDLTDGHEYEIRLKVTATDPARTCWQHAGYIEVFPSAGLSNIQSYQRTQAATGTKSASSTRPHQRQLINIDNFDSPTAYFESTGREPSAGTVTVGLRDHGTADSGTNGSNVTTLAFDSATRVRKRSSSISPDNGDRFMGRIDYTSGSINICNAQTIIEAIAPAARRILIC